MICFVCGQLCSGKTLYSKTLTHINDSVYVEVGDIVRQIKNTQDRSVLQNTKELHNKIVNEIIRLSDINSSKQLVVSGVRQKEILEHFSEATLLWIECTKSIRKQRYLDRKREGDTQSFEEAEQGDINLGILEVRKFILERPEI